MPTSFHQASFHQDQDAHFVQIEALVAYIRTRAEEMRATNPELATALQKLVDFVTSRPQMFDRFKDLLQQEGLLSSLTA